MSNRSVIARSTFVLFVFAGLALEGCAQDAATTKQATAPAAAAPTAKVTTTTAKPAATKTASTLERFLKIRTPGAPTLLPDGTLYVRDWPDGVFQLYRVDGKQAGPGAKTTKLTSYADGLAGYSVSPDGSKILLAYAAGGNENTQIALLDPKAKGGAGAAIDLLKNPKVQFAANRWLDDSSGFFYTGNDASPNDFYIYRYDLSKEPGKVGTSSKILGKEGSWSLQDCNVDGTKVLVAKYNSASDSKAFELSVSSGDLKEITILPEGAKDATAANDVVGYLPGGDRVLMTADIEGLKKLYIRDLKTGKVTKAIPELDKFDIDGASMNKERTLLGVVTNEDGYGVLSVYRLPSFEKVALPAIERGVVSLTEMRGEMIAWNLSNAHTPGLSYAYTVLPPGAVNIQAPQAMQITACDTQGLDLATFPLPEVVKYKAFDGVEIPAFLWLPKGYAKGKSIPFIVNYHGGPEGQSRPTFSATVQYLLNEGFGVLQPNVRGSSGYGREFLIKDDYKKRWDSVRDGVDGAEWLVANGYAKPGRIATYGGSYGGFMSVACVVEDQQRVDAGKRKERLFGAGVDVVGIVNMKTFLEQTSGYRRKLREVEYGPLTDPDFLASISSIHKIDKINVPMMIAHGLNDPRVPVGEAMQLAIGLKKKGLDPVEFYAPDEGHGFQKLENRLLFTERMAKFLKEKIGN